MASRQAANINGTLTFTGSVAGSFTIQAQGIAGDLIMQFPNQPPSAGQALVAQSLLGNNIVCGWASIPGMGGSGTVTSVALTLPSFLSVAGSPITTAGTLAVTLATQTANTVFAGPASAGPSAPTFRALASADIGAGIVATGSLTTVQGNGAKVQLSTGTTTSGNVVTYDASGNTVSSGTALAALATLASPTFTGTVTTGKLKASSPDRAGVLAMTGASTVTYTFASNYTGTNPPVVILTPQFDAGGNNADFWVTFTGGAGAWTAFVVHNSIAQTGNIMYMVIDVG